MRDVYVFICANTCVYMYIYIFYMFTAENVTVPILLWLPENEVTVGEVFTITCETVYPGTGSVLVHNGVPVPPRVMVNTTDYVQSYTFNPILLEDSGVYMCLTGSQTPLETESGIQSLLVGCKL